MANVKTNLNFHQTFSPDANAISMLLSVAEERTAYSKEEISDITGIPTGASSGKVEPFIKYAYFMGLLEDKYKNKKHLLSLTPLGKEVKYQDETLQEKATIYLCHSNLVLSTGATLWNFIFSSIIPRYGNNLRTTVFIDALKNHYKGIVKNTPNEIKFMNTMYKEPYLYIYAYIIMKEWENLHEGVQELTSIDLYNMNMDNKLCLSRSDFDKVLSILENKGMIKVERLLTPFVVLKLVSANDMIEKIYSTI